MNKLRFRKNSYININSIRVASWTCLFCGKQFETNYGYIRHMESHLLKDGGYNYDKIYIYNLRTMRGDFRGRELGQIYWMQGEMRKLL